MDAGVWVGAVTGLAGAVVGAGGSIGATLVTQRYQRTEARREQRERLATETAEAISREFVALHELARSYPAEGAPEDVMRPYRLRSNEHHNSILLALHRLPDRALAERLGDVAVASAFAFQGSEGSYQDRRQGAFSVPYEGLSCLGAFLRGDPLPPPTSYTQVVTRRRRENEAQAASSPERVGGGDPPRAQ
ncbi:hypothetical protein GCM10009577_23530 [Streptomyces javensis]